MGRAMSTAILAVATIIAMPATAKQADGMTEQGKTAEERAASIVDAMTLDEQISLTKSMSGGSLLDLGIPLPSFIPEAMRQPKPDGALGTAGFVPAVDRVGFPALHLGDASLGSRTSAICAPVRNRPRSPRPCHWRRPSIPRWRARPGD